MNQDEVALQEWREWRELCAMLKELGAVTDDDLAARAGRNETPGDRLFIALKKWSDSKVLLLGGNLDPESYAP